MYFCELMLKSKFIRHTVPMQKYFGTKILLVLGFFLVFFTLCPAQNPRISTLRQGNEIFFFGHNAWHNVFQIKIKIVNPQNLADTLNLPLAYYQVLPPLADSLFLFKLSVKDNNTPLKYTWSYAMGNPFIDEVQYDYPYQLPYKHKKRYFLLQGYHGKFSHKREYALDFKMKEGTEICAARGGKVVWLSKDSDEGGKSSKFSALANRIIIEHNDGTYASYFHLKYKGVLVELGEYVNAGQVIGLSGNTGWSSTPHLHFVVKKPEYLSLVSIPTYFLLKPRKKKYPKAWRYYKAYHPR